MRYQIAIAGTSKYSQLAAETLSKDERFQVSFVLTPSAKKIGRKRQLKENPLATWASQEKIPQYLVENKIDKIAFQKFQERIGSPDFLLVIDFGYYIPQWLLDIPRIAPLNIHPSALPAWRGSSPGQFALLFQNFQALHQGKPFGGKQTAASLMLINAKFDAGPILQQLPFQIEENWQRNDYYQYAFSSIIPRLATLLDQFAQGIISPREQSLGSPTPTARRLSKEDSFIDWKILERIISTNNMITLQKRNPAATNLSNFKSLENTGLLMNILEDPEFCQNIAEAGGFLKTALAAFSPWPGLWTIIPTPQGEKRMKILSLIEKEGSWQLVNVQIEGQNPSRFSEIKNIIQKS